MTNDPFPPETHACLLHTEVHPLTRRCWMAIFTFFTQETMHRPQITDSELQQAYDAAFERACLNELVPSRRRLTPVGVAA